MSDDRVMVLDTLPGSCPKCGVGPVIIDGEGMGKPNYWAYCDACNWIGCRATSPTVVLELWKHLPV
jgi:hypothetical protein